MRILFVNDDGYDAYGLHAVAKLFSGDHDIAVVAPDAQRSGYSHSVTLRPDMFDCKKVDGFGYPVYAVSGTPVDCVKTGFSYLFPAPDLVISGINRGRNLGTDILYSGTVSAAVDAASVGYKAIALSLYTDNARDRAFNDCAAFFRKNFDAFLSIDLPRHTCLNINFPAVPPVGVRFARMNPADTFVDVYDSRGVEMSPKGHRDKSDVAADTDEALCYAGYITVTPITTDRTDHETLKKIRKVKIAL